MPNTTKHDFEKGTERINLLCEYVCSVHGWTYAELADELGCNRGWFTRMRNGGLGSWGWSTFVGLVELAAQIDTSMLFDWLCVQQDEDSAANAPVQADLKHDGEAIK